jgi:hypothetical protein
MKTAGDWANSMGETPVVHLFPLCSTALYTPPAYVDLQALSCIDVQDRGFRFYISTRFMAFCVYC